MGGKHRGLLRREDRALLTRGGTYVADVADPMLEGAVHVQFVRSHLAHASIVRIAVDDAATRPGVLGVFTAADLDIGPLPPVLPRFPVELSPPALARDVVRYVGEPVAVVVAETAELAADAVEAVVVDLEPRPAVVAATSATEVVARYEVGDDESMIQAALRECDVVVRAELIHPRVSACPLEGRAAASAWHAGRLHHWVSTQGPHSVKRCLTAMFGLADDAVRVIAPDVGGGFGPKFANSAEDVVTAWVARRVGRPARWVETRRESMLASHHGRGQRQSVVLGGTRDGRLLAYALDVVQDSGAYASLGAYAPEATLRMTGGVYAIPHVRANAVARRTTTTPVSAVRGTGRPEATCAIERAIDLFAAAIGDDPVAVRHRNLITELPHLTPVGTTYDSGDYARVLALACEAARYEQLRAEQRRRRERADRWHLGIGVCVYVESAGAGPPMELATVAVGTDGHMVVGSGSSPHGQGHETTWAQLASDALGIAPDDVTVVHGDTDLVPAGLGTFASRSVQIAGSAIVRASEQLIESGRAAAADLLEAAVDDVTFDRGRFSVIGAPARALAWCDIGAAVPLVERAMFTGAMTFPFGAHVAIVEVDGETGAVQLLRHVAVDDAGTLVNPVLAEGQVHGGIAHGVAEALLEEIRYDREGNPLTTNLADYAMPSAAELPSFETIATETPAPSNPLGAKGIGESGTIGAVAAVQNAVCDALSHLGVDHVDVPLTPERVWRAINAARGA